MKPELSKAELELLLDGTDPQTTGDSEASVGVNQLRSMLDRIRQLEKKVLELEQRLNQPETAAALETGEEVPEQPGAIVGGSRREKHKRKSWF